MKDMKEPKGWKSGRLKAFVLVVILGVFYWLSAAFKPAETNVSNTKNRPEITSITNQILESATRAIRTKTVRAKKNSSHEIVISQPAFVAPYYRVNVFPQAAGIVTFIEKSIGDKVTAGERLVEIQVTGDGTQIASTPEQVAIIRAPFDGVVSVRGVDAGTFVQNAVVVPGVASLMTIERGDIVTVSMFVPENFVAYVDKNTEVIIHLDALPGIAMRAKVSRLAPSLRTSDRTIMAEVDLYNGTAEEFERFAAKMNANDFADLKSRTMPSMPILTGGEQKHIRVLPGMYGQMELLLPALREAEMLPSQVVARRGGVPYIYIVEDGKAKRVWVTVEFDDGTVVRIRPVDRAGRPASALPDTTDYVLSNQGELSDGESLTATRTDW